MAIMATGMHYTRIAGFVAKFVLLGYGQGVHIGAQADCRGIVAALQNAYYACHTQTGMDFQAEFREQICHPRSRSMFFKTKFGMEVEILSP